MTSDNDASCRSVMSAPPAVLKPGDTLSTALRTMIEHRIPALPVTEDDGRYVGMLPRSLLIALAMPRVLSHEDDLYPTAHLLKVGFIADSLADLQERWDAVANDPVSQHVATDVPVLAPDTPLMNAMFFLHRQRNLLPVVEHGMLVGIVSVWGVLARIGRVG